MPIDADSQNHMQINAFDGLSRKKNFTKDCTRLMKGVFEMTKGKFYPEYPGRKSSGNR